MMLLVAPAFADDAAAPVDAPAAAAPAPMAKVMKAKKAVKTGDEKGVEAAFQEVSDAWAAGDAHKVAESFTVDSSLINPFGLEAHGRAEVEKVVAGDLEMMKGSQQTFSDFSIHFVMPTLALVDATGTVTGMKNPDGTDAEAHKFHIYGVVVKRGAKWQAFALRPYAFAPTPGADAAAAPAAVDAGAPPADDAAKTDAQPMKDAK
jgi:uncharacterized protein (TIGR02246 family)